MKKISILHLEDDLNDSELVLDEFRSAGYDVNYTRVDCERDFINQLKQIKFDIILADYSLPSFDGFSALRFCSEEFSETPFIIVSGALGEEIAVKMLKYGATDYLLKQNLKRLVTAVEHALKEARLRREKVETEKAILQSEEKYRRIFENVQDVFYQIDLQGNIIEISPSIFRLSGYKREELLGKSVSSLYFLPEEREMLIQTVYKQGEIWDFEARLRTKIGQIKYTSLNTHIMINSEGKVAGIEGSLRDIDERKHFEIQLKEAKEKAEESDKLKTAFLSNISHEIRTPMNAIMGFLSLLSNPDLPYETQLSYIQTIKEGSNQLLSIINDIVDISRIEANIISCNISSFNINSTLQSLYNQFILKAAENNNTLKLTNVLSDEKAIIQSDSTRLIQILSNLLNNAFKFTCNGEIEFGYTIKRTMLEFFVSDTGIGIAPGHQSKIFDSFYQVETSFSRKYGGTGLGLSICKAYVELLGGKIWLTSEIGKGSVFFFNIPYKTTVPDITIQSKPPVLETSEAKEPPTILVAEDEDNNYSLLEHILSTHNLNVIRATNGYDAVELCRARKNIDLVLMDLKMPRMDGFTATEMIKKMRPSLPVIVQTAFVSENEKAFKCGCSDLIVKPFKKDEVISKVQKCLHYKS